MLLWFNIWSIEVKWTMTEPIVLFWLALGAYSHSHTARMACPKCVSLKPFVSVLASVLDYSKFSQSKISLLLKLCTVWFIQQLVTNLKRGLNRNVITFNMESDIFSFFLINNENQKRQDLPTHPQSPFFPISRYLSRTQAQM